MEKSTTPICFILNTAADKSRSLKHVKWLRKEAEKRWLQVDIVLTDKDQPIRDLAASKAAEFGLIVACGGDGTVHQVVNGIAGTDTRFAVLPVGTGNDFAKSLNLPKSHTSILDLIHAEKFKDADLIRFEGDASGWCVNTLGIGLDGLANHYSKSYSKLKGYSIYILGALKAACTFRGANFNLVAGGRNLSGNYLMATICNGKWEGGTFFIAPDADLFDGKAELVTVKKISIPKILYYMICFKNGPSPWMKALHTEQITSLVFKSDIPVAVHADGEQLGFAIQELKIAVAEGALSVITGY